MIAVLRSAMVRALPGFALLAATVWLLCSGRPAFADQETVTIEIPAICCGTAGQQTSPDLTFATEVTTEGVLIVEYQAPSTHCSSLRQHISVDESEKAVSGYLGYPNDPEGRPMTTGPIDVGPVSSGTHTLSLRAEGLTGGCNGGSLGSWKGTLLVTTGPLPQTGGTTDPAVADVVPQLGGRPPAIENRVITTYAWLGIVLSLAGAATLLAATSPTARED